MYVIGASGVESDVASWDYSARCLASLAAREKIGSGSLSVCLIGPEIPEEQHRKTVVLPLQQRDAAATEPCVRITIYCHRGNFEGYHAFNYSRRPDAVFGFNLGLSVPDYSWGAGLAAVHDCAKTIARDGGPPLPILCTASSRAEAVQELLLFEQHKILRIDQEQTKKIEEGEQAGHPAWLRAARIDATSQKVPDTLVETQAESDNVSDDENEIFLQPNDYGWERVQQSGAMANDVYRKSCWLFGGTVAVGDDLVDELGSEEDERPSRSEIYQARRQARQRRKNKRLKRRAKTGR